MRYSQQQQQQNMRAREMQRKDDEAKIPHIQSCTRWKRNHQQEILNVLDTIELFT